MNIGYNVKNSVKQQLKNNEQAKNGIMNCSGIYRMFGNSYYRLLGLIEGTE